MTSKNTNFRLNREIEESPSKKKVEWPLRQRFEGEDNVPGICPDFTLG